MSYYADYSNYTDGHDVDEDMVTIPHYGGWWTYGTRVGVAYRELYNAPNVLAAVASDVVLIKQKINITHPH